MHAELRRRGVTLMLLWEEYRAEHADCLATDGSATSTASGAGASRRRCGRPVAGEKLFVDFAGDTVPVIQRSASEQCGLNLSMCAIRGVQVSRR